MDSHPLYLLCPREGCDGEVKVEARVEKGIRGTWTHPPEPAYAEIRECWDCEHGHRLTDREVRRLEERNQTRMLETIHYEGGKVYR